MNGNVYSVSQVNNYIKNMFAQDFMLNRIYIKGELSNCKYHSSGHIYFSLKDKGGVIQGVMFAGYRNGLKFRLEDGMQVVCLGSISVYEKSGNYQIYAKEIIQDGSGDLHVRFEQLKKELEEMGMFDEMYKKPIPKYATKIGICTADTGAAIRDIINIATRRNPYVQLYLYPTIVQGEKAVPSIVNAIRYMDNFGVDVIILGRGGGSIEDLWAFNEEPVAKAIFECNTPIISAVGHETDTTIADYVADLRAPTPSAAAELAVFDIDDFIQTLSSYKAELGRKVMTKIELYRLRLQKYQSDFKSLSPKNQLFTKRQYVADLQTKLEFYMHRKLDNSKYNLNILAQKLDGNSPLKKLEKGFAYVSDADDNQLKSVADVSVSDDITLTMKDGRIKAVVSDVEKTDMDYNK
ncbi:MAG: exodeoxyribonuclease VII large subunit [Lachnospiraceae bacterium]|nr:exodeoxyribonuclease VII large subunit [Lachnospiraceae bacterium]